MTVFKGFMRMVKRNINTIIMYTVIFCAICVAVQFATKEDGLSVFQESSLNIAVIDRDQSTLSKGLKEYLGEKHKIVVIADDKKVIQEEMFYRNIYYVTIIPEHFEEDYLANGKKLTTTKIPGTTSAFYVDQQINTFLNDIKILTATGFDIKTAVKSAQEAANTDSKVTLIDKNGNGGSRALHSFMFQYFPYIILASLSYIIGLILMQFRKKEVRQRMLCSAVSSRNQNGQIVLGVLVMGISMWLVNIFLAIIMYGKRFLTDENILYYLANSFCVMLVALAIAFLMGVILKNTVAINGAVNVISLGMCFTCGVFVSLDMLGSGVKKVSQFLPIYWYEIVNNIVADNINFTAAQLSNIYKGFGLQILFAISILGIGLSVSKCREQV